jgi:hypothetical protein
MPRNTKRKTACAKDPESNLIIREKTMATVKRTRCIFDTTLSSASRNSMPVERYPSGVDSCPTEGKEPKAGTNWNSIFIP